MFIKVEMVIMVELVIKVKMVIMVEMVIMVAKAIMVMVKHPLTKWPFGILSLQLFYKLGQSRPMAGKA